VDKAVRIRCGAAIEGLGVVDVDRETVILGRLEGGAEERVLEEMRKVDTGDGVQKRGRIRV
jgi:hypothetical protein